jgi:hypothetical protein
VEGATGVVDVAGCVMVWPDMVVLPRAMLCRRWFALVSGKTVARSPEVVAGLWITSRTS